MEACRGYGKLCGIRWQHQISPVTSFWRHSLAKLENDAFKNARAASIGTKADSMKFIDEFEQRAI